MLEIDEENNNEHYHSEICQLKEEIKSKDFTKIKEKEKKEKPLKLYGNNINDKKPKYYGKTKSLLFIKETPVLILGEDSNYCLNLIIISYFYSFLWFLWLCFISNNLYSYIFNIITKKL